MTIDPSTISQPTHRQVAALPPDIDAAVRGTRSADTDRLTTTVDPASRTSEEESLSFWDFLDVINPLQHIPIVSTIYREITGDEIGDVARVAGGALFGGPIGLAAAGLDYAVKTLTGKHMDEHVVAMVSGDDAMPPATADSPAVAEAATGVTAAAARAPVDAAPMTAQAATDAARADDDAAASSSRTVASADGAKWFPLGEEHRRNPFMPLTAGAREAEARAAKEAAMAAQAQAQPDAAAAAKASLGTTGARDGASRDGKGHGGTVEVMPLGGAGTGKPSAATLPLGLLQGVADDTAPVSLTSPGGVGPSPEAVRRAARAQGLDSGAHPLLAAAEAQAATKSGPAATPFSASSRRASGATASLNPSASARGQAASTESGGDPIAVPAWFDTAMTRALDAYEKTGRLGGG